LFALPSRDDPHLLLDRANPLFNLIAHRISAKRLAHGVAASEAARLPINPCHENPLGSSNTAPYQMCGFGFNIREKVGGLMSA
jgi:hypothetical protein